MRALLWVANLPNAQFDGAAGRFMFGQLCLAAEFQRNLDSERMTGLQHHLFEEGHHRGHDPFGYRSRRDAGGNLEHPRQLEIVPEEAAAVRRIWAELAHHSIDAVSDRLNRDGVLYRSGGLWTRDAVKDVWRRGRVYCGFVVERRGRDERPGCHEPIRSEAQYRRTVAAVAARRCTGNMQPTERECSTYVMRSRWRRRPGGMSSAASSSSGLSSTVATWAKSPGHRPPGPSLR